jgi:uncharacterized membrane protein YphA (DoxX/SURF4 family)
MLRFALPKLQAMEVSVKSFTMFSTVLPVNPTFFMYFTGIVELLIAILLLTSLLIKNINLKNRLQTIGYFFLLSTMIGSILIEQFVRPEPKSFLMTIALVLLTISISELSLLTQKNKIKD